MKIISGIFLILGSLAYLLSLDIAPSLQVFLIAVAIVGPLIALDIFFSRP